MFHRFYEAFDPSRIIYPIFSHNDLAVLEKFSSDKSIVISKPDKGRGVVILDRTAYIEKMEAIVGDNSVTKFSLVREPMMKTIGQVEDRINRLLSKLKSVGMITDDLFKRLFVSALG